MAEFTVIGFIDESGDVHVAGVVEGNHQVHQSYFDRWVAVVEANSAEEAETLGFDSLADSPADDSDDSDETDD